MNNISSSLKNEPSNTIDLQKAIELGIINPQDMQEKIRMAKREEILKTHPYEIWLGKNGKWYTYLPDENKKRKLIKRNNQSSIEDAVINFYNQQYNDGKKKNISLKELFPEWIDYKSKHTRSSSYIKRITSDWEKYYQPQVEFINTPIHQFTKIELDNWAHDMIKNHKLSKKQYYNMSIILRQELEYAKECQYITKNVFAEVIINTKMFRRVKKKNNETQVFLTDEIPRIIDDMFRRFSNNPSDTSPLAILLDFEIGVRIGELVALKRSDIEKDGNYIHIQRQCIRTFKPCESNPYKMKFSGFEIVDYTKSDDGDREIYLTDIAKKILRLIFWTNEKYHHSCDDFIFVRGNQPISHYVIQSKIIKGCESIGIITKTMHKVRKTYISSLIDSGLNIDEIRRQAGHSDERTTYGNYCFNRKTNTETEQIMENALYYECLPEKVIKGNQIYAGENLINT